MTGRRGSPQSYQITVTVKEALNELAATTAPRRFGARSFPPLRDGQSAGREFGRRKASMLRPTCGARRRQRMV